MQDLKRAVASCVLVLFVALPAMGAAVESIPKPPPGHWSVDTTGTLRPETLAEVDRIGTQLNASGHGQLAVVMVDSTEGRQPRAYATELFNRWGIGNADRDDGALLFVAMTDRKVEIVLGDGVDSAEDTQRSDAVMASILPLFKRGDANSAVLEGTRGLNTLLAQHPASTTSGTHMSLGGGSAIPMEVRGETASPRSNGLFALLAIIAVLAGVVALHWGDRNSKGPRKPRPPGDRKSRTTAPYWGGGFFGGGGYSGGGSSGGGGGFGGGGSSGGGSSGSF